MKSASIVYKVCKIKKGHLYSAAPMYREGRGPAVRYEIGQRITPVIDNSPLMAFSDQQSATEFANRIIFGGSWNEVKTFGVFKALALLCEDQTALRDHGLLDFGLIQIPPRRLVRRFWNEPATGKAQAAAETVFCKWIELSKLITTVS